MQLSIYNHHNVKKNITNLVLTLEALADSSKFLFPLTCCFVAATWVSEGGGDAKMSRPVIALVLELDNCFFLLLESACVCTDLPNSLSFAASGEGVVVGFLGVAAALLFSSPLKDI